MMTFQINCRFNRGLNMILESESPYMKITNNQSKGPHIGKSPSIHKDKVSLELREIRGRKKIFITIESEKSL